MYKQIDSKEIGERLRKLRGYKPRRVVSEETGITERAIACYEMGERLPKDNVKIQLAEYYGTSVEAIFFAHETTRNE